MLALVVSATGCGGGGSSTEALTGHAVSTQPEAGGVTVYAVRSAGFSIAVPRSWKVVTRDDLNDSGSQVDSELLAELAKANTTVRFISLDGDATNGYHASMTVTVMPAPDFSIEALASQEYADQYASTYPAPLLSAVGHELVSLPAGKAAHLWYTYRSPASQANRVLTTHEYHLFAEGKVYILIANVLPGREREYLGTVLDSARSLRPLT
jgi:hypothetical protein